MKTKIKFMLVALMATVIFSSCERVAPNYAGVLMENYGKEGKEDLRLYPEKFPHGNGEQSCFRCHCLNSVEDFRNQLP